MEYFLSGVAVRSSGVLSKSRLNLNLSRFLFKGRGGELLPLLFAIEKFSANLFNSVTGLAL